MKTSLKPSFSVQNVLVAIDLLEGSEATFHMACQFARTYQAKLFIFHSCHFFDRALPEYAHEYLHNFRTEREPSLLKLAQNEMETFLKKHDLKDIEIESIVQTDQPIASQILEFAEKLNAGMIVVGTHGKTGVERLSRGSVAEKVLEQAKCPVLVLKDTDPHPHKNLAKIFPRILVSTDFSEHSEHAMLQGLNLGKKLNAEMDLVHVIESHVFLPITTFNLSAFMEEYQIELKKEVNEKFKKYVDQFTDSRDFFKLHIFEGAPAKEILHACKKFKANLLILGSHGHARFSNLLLGSTANRVIQHACCPVMIIK